MHGAINRGDTQNTLKKGPKIRANAEEEDTRRKCIFYSTDTDVPQITSFGPRISGVRCAQLVDKMLLCEFARAMHNFCVCTTYARVSAGFLVICALPTQMIRASQA
jgi:hypothetical protein